MATANSTRGSAPGKPYPDYPLSWHPRGYFCKKILGKVHYFGPRHCTWQEALDEYKRQADDLHAGRKPRENTDGITVQYACNHFLTDRELRLNSGELTQRSFNDYKSTCTRLVREFGAKRLLSDLRSDDFGTLRKSYSKTWGPTTVGNEIQRVRVILKYAFDVELIDKPIRPGPSFRKPSAKVLRQHRQAKGKRLFTTEQIHELLGIASVEIRAAIMLALNCGFGNRDVATLTIKAIDFERGWIDYPRPKTAIERRCHLWPETLQALRDVLEKRKQPKDPAHQDLLFVTKYGGPWFHEGRRADPISFEFRKLLNQLQIYRPGLSFYALRHQFETVAGESLDQIAVNAIMGHAPPANDMSAIYREGVSDERLERVSSHVRTWLFGGVT